MISDIKMTLWNGFHPKRAILVHQCNARTTQINVLQTWTIIPIIAFSNTIEEYAQFVLALLEETWSYSCDIQYEITFVLLTLTKKCRPKVARWILRLGSEKYCTKHLKKFRSIWRTERRNIWRSKSETLWSNELKSLKFSQRPTFFLVFYLYRVTAKRKCCFSNIVFFWENIPTDKQWTILGLNQR